MAAPNEIPSVHDQASSVEAVPPLAELGDEAYLRVSHAFGQQYTELLGTDGTMVDGPMAEQVRKVAESYLKPLEGMDDTQVAETMVRGYRDAYNRLLQEHGKSAEFSPLNPEDLQRVRGIGRTPTGLPVLYITGNGVLFGHDAASFASSQLMMEAGLPPLIVVNDSIADKATAATHETSHATFALLQEAGQVPLPDGEMPALGFRSAFDTARDEAAAMQAAGQGKIIHPSVISRLQQDGFDEAVIDRYRASCIRYGEAVHGNAAFEQPDAVLGFVQSRDWDGFFAHVDRVTRIAEAAQRKAQASAVAKVVVPAAVGGGSGRGTA